MSDTVEQHVNNLKAMLPNLFMAPGKMSATELADAAYLSRVFENLLKARAKLFTEVLQTRYQPAIESCTREEPTFVIAGGFTPGFMGVKVWQKRLDTDRIIQEMGEAWVEDHKSEIDFIQLKTVKPG